MDSWLDFSTLRGTHLLPSQEWTLFGSPEAINSMPVLHQKQIILLDHSSTCKAYKAFNQCDLLCGDDGWGNRPFSAGCFRNVVSQSTQGAQHLKKWLYQRTLTFSTSVLILPVFSGVDDPAILTNWKMVVKYAPDLFSHDNLVLVGATQNWCLYYHHDRLITFANQPYPKNCGHHVFIAK